MIRIYPKGSRSAGSPDDTNRDSVDAVHVRALFAAFASVVALTGCVGTGTSTSSPGAHSAANGPAPAAVKSNAAGAQSARLAAADDVFPEAYLQGVSGAQRFRNPTYFKLLAGSGVRLVDPKTLFARMQAAAAENDRYKALYLSRMFTQVAPENATGWSNRARLASDLGLSGEAAVSDANAHSAGQAARPPSELLPGVSSMPKPASLRDWAAAVAVLSDAVVEREGSASLIAVEDSVSGVREATRADIYIVYVLRFV
jgi:hypothetical protein